MLALSLVYFLTSTTQEQMHVESQGYRHVQLIWPTVTSYAILMTHIT